MISITDKRNKIYSGTCKDLRIIRKELPESLFDKFTLKHGDIVFPALLNSATVITGTTKIYDFVGNIFSQHGNDIVFEIYKYPNGVVNAEIEIV